MSGTRHSIGHFGVVALASGVFLAVPQDGAAQYNDFVGCATWCQEQALDRYWRCEGKNGSDYGYGMFAGSYIMSCWDDTQKYFDSCITFVCNHSSSGGWTAYGCEYWGTCGIYYPDTYNSGSGDSNGGNSGDSGGTTTTTPPTTEPPPSNEPPSNPRKPRQPFVMPNQGRAVLCTAPNAPEHHGLSPGCSGAEAQHELELDAAEWGERSGISTATGTTVLALATAGIAGEVMGAGATVYFARGSGWALGRAAAKTASDAAIRSTTTQEVGSLTTRELARGLGTTAGEVYTAFATAGPEELAMWMGLLLSSKEPFVSSSLNKALMLAMCHR